MLDKIKTVLVRKIDVAKSMALLWSYPQGQWVKCLNADDLARLQYALMMNQRVTVTLNGNKVTEVK